MPRPRAVGKQAAPSPKASAKTTKGTPRKHVAGGSATRPEGGKS